MITPLLGFAFVWWVLAEGDLSTWPAALLAVPAAAVTFRALGGGVPRLRFAAAAAFVPWFFVQSVRGGLDVALRAFAPRVRIDPALRSYPLRLRGPAARTLFVNAVSLLPGTFGARLEGDVVTLHLLDGSISDESVRAVEARVGAMFGVELT